MMMKKKLIMLVLIARRLLMMRLVVIAMVISMVSCKKEFLSEKPSSNLNVPSSLDELRLLLINPVDIRKSPSLGELSSDDYYMTRAEWSGQFLPYFSNAYVWKADIYEGADNVNDWNLPYTQVLYANVVLQQLKAITRSGTNAAVYDELKGAALFMRAWSFFDLAQVFAPPYDAQTAAATLGIPIRETAYIGAPTSRASLQETYTRILADLGEAGQLIQTQKPALNGYMPSKLAVYGLLSRVYLNMRDYPRAGLYADSALAIRSNLINYNTVNASAAVPFSYDHAESIYQNTLVTANPLTYVVTSQGYSVDTLLYASYAANDLRKSIYFSVNGKYINKKRGYSGSINISNGLATDELYLIRSECFARAAQEDRALADLNTLLVNRWKSGTFSPVSGISGKALLDRILLERRKELVFRGQRWNDLRRLNMEGYGISLVRNLDGEVFRLAPNSARYTFPIPPNVIALTGIKQNLR
ncbi:RagB/SusD family nutrient uptake outer membrane protein [Agrobacterium tumefaciens]|nr:RagB/SusD family nutrient uptake outer membrane protein [Agrobacterium tumefaciens]